MPLVFAPFHGLPSVTDPSLAAEYHSLDPFELLEPFSFCSCFGLVYGGISARPVTAPARRSAVCGPGPLPATARYPYGVPRRFFSRDYGDSNGTLISRWDFGTRAVKTHLVKPVTDKHSSYLQVCLPRYRRNQDVLLVLA